MSSGQSTGRGVAPDDARHGFLGRLRKGNGVAHAQGTQKPEGPSGKDFEGRLKEAKFPIRNRASLVAALGGTGAKVAVRDGVSMVSDEIADLCFAEVDLLTNPEDAAAALYRSNWIRAVFKALNLAWLPIRGPDRVSRLAGHIRVKGVPVKALAPSLGYPIVSTADLVEKLAKARQSYQG